jgi:hypothetical protein
VNQFTGALERAVEAADVVAGKERPGEKAQP